MNFDLASRVHRPSKKDIVLPLLAPTHAQMLTLAAIYLKIVNLWAEAAQRIQAAYETGLNSSANGPADAAREISNTAAEAQRLILTSTPLFAAWTTRVEMVQQAKWVKSILMATKVDIKPFLMPGDVSAFLKASADWNAALIKDVSAEIQRKISNIVFAGFQRRAPVAEIAKEISESIGMARRRSRNIAYDQLNKLAAALNKARQQQAGITKYVWIHSAKLHARPVHLARNGKVFPWDGPGAVPPGDGCGEPPFCGCTARAVVTFEREPTAA